MSKDAGCGTKETLCKLTAIGENHCVMSIFTFIYSEVLKTEIRVENKNSYFFRRIMYQTMPAPIHNAERARDGVEVRSYSIYYEDTLRFNQISYINIILGRGP